MFNSINVLELICKADDFLICTLASLVNRILLHLVLTQHTELPVGHPAIAEATLKAHRAPIYIGPIILSHGFLQE